MSNQEHWSIPGMPQFVSEGMHFEKGDPLYIIEVTRLQTAEYLSAIC